MCHFLAINREMMLGRFFFSITKPIFISILHLSIKLTTIDPYWPFGLWRAHCKQIGSFLSYWPPPLQCADPYWWDHPPPRWQLNSLFLIVAVNLPTLCEHFGSSLSSFMILLPTSMMMVVIIRVGHAVAEYVPIWHMRRICMRTNATYGDDAHRQMYPPGQP